MKRKKSKILAAIFSITVLLSGACLVGCSGTNGVFGPAYNDWQEGENKVGNMTVNLAGFNKVELSDTTDKNDVETVAGSADSMLWGFHYQCLYYAYEASEFKKLDDYEDQIKFSFLTSEFSKCKDKPTDKSLIESTAKDMAANHISYFQEADKPSNGCVLYQVEMSDDVWNKILNQDGSGNKGVTEVAPGVYKSNVDAEDSTVQERTFYCVRNNGIFTLVFPAPEWMTNTKTLLSKIVSY